MTTGKNEATNSGALWGGRFADGPAEAMAALAPSFNYLGWGVMGLGAVVMLLGGAMGWKSSSPPSA